MRTIVAALLFLAIPTFAAAQQQADPVETAPVIQLHESDATPAGTATAVDVEATGIDAPETETDVQTRDLPMEDAAALQDAGSRQWWYLVGAIVVGGLILAVLL